MTSQEIIALLPYDYPFLFVDEVLSIDANTVTGTYTYGKDLPFYDGHFRRSPVTPGVILTETMAQIGLVCLGIYLLHEKDTSPPPSNIQIAMTSAAVDYYIPVLPEEKVWVTSTKEYFRFNKLKCAVLMHNSKQELVCRGSISGMIKT